MANVHSLSDLKKKAKTGDGTDQPANYYAGGVGNDGGGSGVAIQLPSDDPIRSIVQNASAASAGASGGGGGHGCINGRHNGSGGSVVNGQGPSTANPNSRFHHEHVRELMQSLGCPIVGTVGRARKLRSQKCKLALCCVRVAFPLPLPSQTVGALINGPGVDTVSYTHLTLPTIYSV